MNLSDSVCTACMGSLKKLQEGGDLPSPFQKNVVLDFYDGPLSGVLKCDLCGFTYHYKTLDWDKNFEKRIFALTLLPANAFDKLVELAARGVQTPRWPVWSPNRLADEPEHSDTDKSIDQLLQDAGNPCLIIAADRYMSHIRQSRIPTSDLYMTIQKSNSRGIPNPALDWFEYIGVQR